MAHPISTTPACCTAAPARSEKGTYLYMPGMHIAVDATIYGQMLLGSMRIVVMEYQHRILGHGSDD